MYKKNSQSGSAHTLLIILIFLIVMGGVGYLFWKNKIKKNDISAQNTTAQTAQATQQQPETKYITYTTDTHPVTFQYPDTWKLQNPQKNDQYTFYRAVDVATDKDDVVSFSTGGQGAGGACGEAPEKTRMTIDATPTTLKTPKTTTASFTVTKNDDGSYDAKYGLTDTYTSVGDKQACDNTYYYMFNSASDTYMLMAFSGTKHIANLDDAKAFVAGSEYAAIKKMLLSLQY